MAVWHKDSLRCSGWKGENRLAQSVRTSRHCHQEEIGPQAGSSQPWPVRVTLWGLLGDTSRKPRRWVDRLDSTLAVNKSSDNVRFRRLPQLYAVH